MEEIKKQGMESLFCPYEQALSLKELGFDEASFGHYRTYGKNLFYATPIARNLPARYRVINAPLYQQTFRWFREKYGLYFSIQYFQYDEWCLQITTKKEDTVFNYKSIDGFKTYEEAELACLIKLIEIVKNK
jgi:hypothetical protein